MGNIGPVFFRQSSLGDIVKKIYNLNKDAKYVGMFDLMNPVLVIRDLELIKSIAVKNFDIFPDHRGFIDEVNDPLFGKNLFSLRGDKWRDVRAILSPAFTSSKMKAMFHLMSNCAANFADHLSQTPSDMEMKSVLTKFTTDAIATCAFGINVDSMKHPDNEFYTYGKQAANFDLVRFMKFYFARSMPVVSKYLGIKFISDRIGKFFKDVVKNTIHARDTQNIVRPDMIQLMMETRGKRGDRELTIEDMTAQAFIFFLGGFDTTANLMAFTTHEVAVNPDIQMKLRDEINNVLKTTNGILNYEAVNGMQYLDAVINEVLRMYPQAIFLDRMCTQDFELPPALPGGKPFVIKKGMNVWFPTYGIQHDPDYYENPEKFCPERFLDEDKKDKNPTTFIPFGIGPRICIGNRFALLEAKVMLIHLLDRCELKPCAKTTNPMRFKKGTFAMLAENGFWIKIQARNDTHGNISTNAVNANAINSKM